MFFSKIGLFACLAMLATAAPTATPTTHLYICTDASFAGTCSNLWLKPSQCQNMSEPYTHSVSSAGPDRGTFCTIYSEVNCEGKALPFTNPGIRSLKRLGFEDLAMSVRCDFIAGYEDHP